MPASMRAFSIRSRSQRWNSLVTNRSAMKSTMPARMRTSENRNWPISTPNSRPLSQSRMSAPENPHCSMRTGRRPTARAKVSASSVSRAS